jgi:hypothetical protein
MSTPSSAVEARPPISNKRLWFGVLAAAVAWAGQNFLSVWITTEACQGQWRGTAHLLLTLLTLAALALAVAGSVVTYRNWQRRSTQTSLTHAEGRDREEFVALSGIFVSIIFTIGILWSGLPPVLLNLCEVIR